MRIPIVVVGIVVACVAALGTAQNAGTHPAVQPNQDFSNPTLQVRAPSSEGWSGISLSANRISFGKSGSDSDESYVATVVLFRVPDFANPDAFTNYVKKGAEEDAPPDRFETLEATAKYSSDRGYPCVKYHAVAKDKKAHTLSIFRKALRFEVTSLYCQHPSRPNLGFMASYSHRGGNPNEQFAEDADKFINSIQATPQASMPEKKPE